MEDTEPIPKSDRTVQDHLCEEEGCSTEAMYVCTTDNMMLLCEGCKDEEHKGCKVKRYYHIKSLYTQVRQVTGMVKHIVKDCKLFKQSPTVEKILEEVSVYQSEVDKLGESIESCLKSDVGEYRRISSDLNKQALKIRTKLLNSDMCHSYSKLYIKHHLRDMSIYEEQRERDNQSEAWHATKKSYLQSESSVTVTTDEAAGVADLVNKLMNDIKLEEAGFKKIIQVRDHQTSELQQQVDDLLNAIQAREDKILGLQQKLQETSADETKSEQEEEHKISKGKQELCGLAIEFGTIIDLIETEENVPELISDLTQHLSEVKQQLDERVDDENCLNIDMSKEDDIKLVKLLKYFRLSKLNGMHFDYVDENNSDIVKLMTNSFPSQFSKFRLNDDADEMINIDYYMNPLLKCIPNVTKYVEISSCEMNTSQFSTLIKASSHIEGVGIYLCKINGDDEFDFCITKPYSIKKINLFGTCDENLSEGSTYKQQYISIFKAISKSGLKHSLKHIIINACEIEKEEGQTYVEKFGLDHIKVTF